MILTIAEDFTNTVTLDSELTSLPSGGMYLNSGVHPSITVENLLSFLPSETFTFTDYDNSVTYGKYTDSRKVSDIVLDNDIIYQSISSSNSGNTPADNPLNWLETNIESLRIKSFVLRSQDNAKNKLNLNKRLIDSQYLYNIVEVSENPTITTLPNDYTAWVFEPKGSDYVSFEINQIGLQATTSTPQSLYVINQGVLIDTLTLTTNLQGRLVFEDFDYVFYGKGKWIFAIDSQDVLTNGSVIDPLNYDGFVAYTATGIGDSPEDAEYSYSSSNNGLNFNITTFLDSNIYLDNNLKYFSSYLQSAWELDVLNMFLSNPNNRSNLEQRTQMDRQLLLAETKELNAATVVRKFEKEHKKAIKKLEKTYDTEINDNGFEIKITSI